MSDVRDFFEEIKETREGFRANCPKCDDSERKFHWNEEKGAGCCFHSSCDWYYERGGVYEARLRAFFGDAPVLHTPTVIRASETSDVQLPEEFKLLEDAGSVGEMVVEYLRGRGLKKRVIENAQVGYCKKGRFWGYIIFPVFDNDEVVYWQGRRFKKRDPKFWNPESSKKTEFIFQLDNGVQKARRVILVESIINAMTLHDGHDNPRNAVFALIGKTLSDAQLQRIMVYEKWMKEIVVALDPDAWRDAVGIAKRLHRTSIRVRLARVTKGEDINTLGYDRGWSVIENSVTYRLNEHLKFMAMKPGVFAYDR